MYIWKIDELNQQLISSNLTEPDVFKYLMAWTVLNSLAMIRYLVPNQYDTYNGVMSVVISIIGLAFIYICNGGKNGSHLLERYLSIGWVVFVRFLVLFFLPAYIAMFTIQEIYMGGIAEQTTEMDMAFYLILEVVYILWCAKHINFVAKQSQAEQVASVDQ